MQHFDLYYKYNILIKNILYVKISFPCPQISSEFKLKPLFPFRLKTQEPTPEHPAQFAPSVFEVLGPDALDTVICLDNFLPSEFITISSHAFSCLWARIHSLFFYNLFAWFGRLFVLVSLFKQKELCKRLNRF